VGALGVLDQITPLIITYNEAPNLRRTLAKLVWARRIVVIDSGSTDQTLEIIRSHSRADAIHRPFKDFASQCNFGLTQVITPWVLSLDADYELSDELVRELRSLSSEDRGKAYRARFVYRVYGKPLRGSLYPPRVVLYQKERASYRNEGHGHRVMVDAEICQLKGVIYHDDRKPLADWIGSQQRYARAEAQYLLADHNLSRSRMDRLRRMGWPAPMVVVFYTLVVKGCLLDGWPGWFYALQRLFAEVLIALEVFDRRLQARKSQDSLNE
jgi:hypothetical protein